MPKNVPVRWTSKAFAWLMGPAFDGRAISEEDYPALEAACKELVAQKAPFQRLLVSKEDAVEMFSYNPYKATILKEKVCFGMNIHGHAVLGG